MTCAQCNSENPAGARFCCQCGTPLRCACAGCGTESLPGARFCHGCGAPLPGTKAPAVAGTPPPAQHALVATRPPMPLPAAERRHLTVMFCDVVGSTALSRELDPEDLQLVLREYQAVGEAMIRRYDGNVAQFLGDGILVYFGHPQAHEDDPHRAVRAGLAIVEAL
ncbi:MAG: adenylate/guanylate cyclase domain-containing protein, partial [Verrucomicrobia bacterium]|nr:adenylate/guanylate cyclase domain-containing protein [Verrucomicrobiota bacterium]